MLFPRRKAAQQDAEADGLAEDGGKSRAADAHAECEDKKRIQPHVEEAAAAKADHGQHRLPLGAEDVVEHKGSAHNRRAQQM